VEDHRDGKPVREITLNQIVAWNLAWYRRRAGLTQVQLGERLGWAGKTSVSEAERSWDGKRVREFDAQTTAAIARALGVPLMALYLPPADDGFTCMYHLTPPGSEEKPMPMPDVMAYLVMPDFPSDDPVMEAYRHRLREAVALYLDPAHGTDVDRWLSPGSEESARDDAAALYESRAELLADIMDDYIARAAFLRKPRGAAGEES
jgi:transcriptional regulator with XRE-family HTH domain